MARAPLLALVLASFASDVHAFGYPDDIFFTGLRVVPLRCGHDFVSLPRTRPIVLLAGVSSDDRSMRTATRRVARAQRRQLAACGPDYRDWSAHWEVVVELRGGDARARVTPDRYVEEGTRACVEAVFARASWPSIEHGDAIVYLHWSVFAWVLGPIE